MNALPPNYEWRPIDDAPVAPTRFDPDPFATWKRLKSGAASKAKFLVQLPKDSSDEVETLRRLGLEAAPIYPSSGRKFWTVHTLDPSAGAATSPNQPLPEPTWPAWLSGMRVVAGDDITLRRPGSNAAHAPIPLAAADDSRRNLSLPFSKPQGAAPPVIAVIDTTCAFLHSAFRKRGETGQTRILALWDQDEEHVAVPPWKPVEGFGYGRELSKAEIDTLIERADQAKQRSVYKDVGQDIPDLSAPWSHGTQVLAIAGGLNDPFAPAAAPTDVAGSLDLIAVQLPLGAVGHTHGVWLNTYVLDGIHYALRRAPPDSPVIVNISMGGSLGPHDGNSLLEHAIDDLVDAWNGRLTVVLAAGNAREGEMHAVAEVQPGRPAVTSLSTNPQDGTPNFVDMWLTLAKGCDVQMLLTVQDGNGPLAHEAAVRPGQSWGLFKTGSPKGSPPVALACLSRAGKAVNGAGMQAFVGIDASQNSGVPGAAAPVGRWTISLESTTKETAVAHAWIGRDDIPAGFPGEQEQLRFNDPPPTERFGTLSSLAGGHRTVVVGAYEVKANGSVEMFQDSGEGGGRFRAPDTCGATSTARTEGAPEVSFYSDPPRSTGEGDTRKGTSIAAPFVARRLANLVAAQDGAWLQRDVLLSKLESGSHELQVDPPDQVGWTAKFWVAA